MEKETNFVSQYLDPKFLYSFNAQKNAVMVWYRLHFQTLRFHIIPKVNKANILARNPQPPCSVRVDRCQRRRGLRYLSELFFDWLNIFDREIGSD